MDRVYHFISRTSRVVYLLWEINFLKEIGYDLNLKNYYSKNLDNNSISSIILDNEKIKVPNFLLNQNFVSINKELIYLAFKFMGNYMYKQIFKPNNITYWELLFQILNTFILTVFRNIFKVNTLQVNFIFSLN